MMKKITANLKKVIKIYYYGDNLKPRFIKIHAGRGKKLALQGFDNDTRNRLRMATNQQIEEYNSQFVDSSNCIAICGRNPSGYSLVVVDFDRLVTNEITMTTQSDEQLMFNRYVGRIIAECFNWDPNQTPLYLVHSGGLGYHLYFYVDTREHNQEIYGDKLRNLKDEASQSFLKEIDVLAEGNLIFGPGCDFTAFQRDQHSFHVMPYTLQADVDVPVISVAQYQQFLTNLRGFVLRVVDTAQTPLNTNMGLLNAENMSFVNGLRARDAFKRILKGEIIVDNVSFEHLADSVRGGTIKFVVWSAFWREMLKEHNYAEIKERLFCILQITQPEFSLETTQTNLARVERQHKNPITKPTYTKYFDPWTSFLEETEGIQYPEPDNELGITDAIDKYNWAKILGQKLIEKFHVFQLVDSYNGKDYGYYNGKTYVIDTNYVTNLVLKYLPIVFAVPSMKNKNEVLMHIGAKNYYKLKDFDCNRNLIVFQNGIYDLITRDLTPHTPNILTMRISPYNYLPNQREIPTITLRFLDGLGFSEDEKMRLVYITKAYVEGDMAEMKLFAVFWGVPNSGKSKYASKIGHLIGEAGKDWRTMRLQKTAGQFGLQGLAEARYVVMDDTNTNALNPTTFAVLKTMTSGDYMEIEEKYKKSSGVRVNFGLCVTCNQLMRLPSSEEINSLVCRSIMFKFIRSHTTSSRFIEGFLDDYNDNEQYLSYLLNLDRIPINEINPMPDFERDMFNDLTDYWLRNANPVYMLCAKHITPQFDMKIEINSFLNALQSIANDEGLSINTGDRWVSESVKRFCRQEHGAKTPTGRYDENRVFKAWICGVTTDIEGVEVMVIDDPSEMTREPADVMPQTVVPEPMLITLDGENVEGNEYEFTSFDVNVFDYLSRKRSKTDVGEIIKAFEDNEPAVRESLIKLEICDKVKKTKSGLYYALRTNVAEVSRNE